MGNDGDGGTRDGVQPEYFFIRARLADFDLVGHGFAQILGIEIEQCRLGNAEQQDGFGMLEHLDTDKDAFGVHADECYHRFAGIGGCVGDVGREHHIAEQFFVGTGFIVSLDVGRLALAFGKMRGTGEDFGARQQCAHVGGAGQACGQLGLVGIGLHARREQGKENKKSNPEDCAPLA